MDKSFYYKYLASPQWKAKREAYFARHGKRCEACFTVYGPIQLHHMTYERLGRESFADVVALCAACHREVESLYRRSGRADRRLVTIAFMRAKRTRRGRRRK